MARPCAPPAIRFAKEGDWLEESLGAGIACALDAALAGEFEDFFT